MCKKLGAKFGDIVKVSDGYCLLHLFPSFGVEATNRICLNYSLKKEADGKRQKRDTGRKPGTGSRGGGGFGRLEKIKTGEVGRTFGSISQTNWRSIKRADRAEIDKREKNTTFRAD